MSAASTKAAPELVHKDEAIRSEQVPGPRPAGNNPESTQTKSKPAHKPLREGFKDGFREVLIIEGLRDRPETEDDKEDQKKGIPKSQESPRVAEELNPSTSTPSSLESRPNQNIDSATVSQSMGGHLPPSPSEVAKEEAAIGSPPILITEPTQTTTSSPSMSKEPSTAAAALDPDPPESPGHKRSEQSPEDDLLDAAWNGDMEAAIKALRYAPPGICDDHGMTPLHLSAERDRMPVSMLLLDRGASISARSDGGRTPLHLAARSATSPMVEMLLERGKANANAETSKGRTPLHYAASKASDGDEEKREVLRVLRDWGADPTIKDIDGETARDVAQKREHWDAAATLRRAEKRWEEDHKQNWLQRHGFKK